MHPIQPKIGLITFFFFLPYSVINWLLPQQEMRKEWINPKLACSSPKMNLQMNFKLFFLCHTSMNLYPVNLGHHASQAWTLGRNSTVSDSSHFPMTAFLDWIPQILVMGSVAEFTSPIIAPILTYWYLVRNFQWTVTCSGFPTMCPILLETKVPTFFFSS